MRTKLIVGALLLLASALAAAKPTLQQIAEFSIPEANQGIGVDDRHFYAIDNRAIAKYDKKTGKLVKKWEGEKDGPIIHLDSAMVMNGKIYCAHSNYNQWPMTSSVEIWDAETLEHVGTHSFGIERGSLTWIDFHDNHWWMTFANYDRPFGPNKTPVRAQGSDADGKDRPADFRVVQAWVLPKAILDRFEEMSNSGGSWGADGFLYLSGHDPAEIYKMRLPRAGSILELVEILPMNIRGQGIAWDRSERNVIYGIIRATAAERAAGRGHRVTVFRLVDSPN